MNLTNILSFLRDPNQFGIVASSALAAGAAASCASIPTVLALAAATFSSYVLPHPVQSHIRKPNLIKERTEELNLQIRKIWQEMIGRGDPIDVRLDSFCGPFSGSTDGKTIFLSYDFLIKTKDIPERFKVSGPKDPKLDSISFLQEVDDWISELFNLKKRSLKSHQDGESLALFLQLHADPVLSEKGKEFTLRHEMAHVLLNHAKEKRRINLDKPISSACRTPVSCFTGISLLGLTIFLSILFHPFIPIIILAAFFIYFVVIAAQIILESNRAQRRELEADLTAAYFSKHAAEGGAYKYEVMTRHFATKWDRPLNLTHPSYHFRAAYLRDIASK